MTGWLVPAGLLLLGMAMGSLLVPWLERRRAVYTTVTIVSIAVVVLFPVVGWVSWPFAVGSIIFVTAARRMASRIHRRLMQHPTPPTDGKLIPTKIRKD